MTVPSLPYYTTVGFFTDFFAGLFVAFLVGFLIGLLAGLFLGFFTKFIFFRLISANIAANPCFHLAAFFDFFRNLIDCFSLLRTNSRWFLYTTVCLTATLEGGNMVSAKHEKEAITHLVSGVASTQLAHRLQASITIINKRITQWVRKMERAFIDPLEYLDSR